MVVYESLTGRRPYQEFENMSQISKVIKADNKRPSIKVDINKLNTCLGFYFAGLSQRFMGDLMIQLWLQHPSNVYQHFHPTSSETTMPIQFIFIWSFFWMGEQKVVQIILVTHQRWQSHPYGKNTKNSFVEPMGLRM